MRNSKIILGALTLVLGVAGAVSTMATSRVLTKARIWATTIGGLGLTCITFNTACLKGSAVTCKTVGNKTVFTLGSVNCTAKFKRPAS